MKQNTTSTIQQQLLWQTTHKHTCSPDRPHVFVQRAAGVWITARFAWIAHTRNNLHTSDALIDIYNKQSEGKTENSNCTTTTKTKRKQNLAIFSVKDTKYKTVRQQNTDQTGSTLWNSNQQNRKKTNQRLIRQRLNDTTKTTNAQRKQMLWKTQHRQQYSTTHTPDSQRLQMFTHTTQTGRVPLQFTIIDQ